MNHRTEFGFILNSLAVSLKTSYIFFHFRIKLTGRSNYITIATLTACRGDVVKLEQKFFDAGGLQRSFEQAAGRVRRQRLPGSVSIIISEDDLNDCSSLTV